VIEITADVLIDVLLVKQIAQCRCFRKVDRAFILVHLVLFKVELEDGDRREIPLEVAFN